MDLSESSDSTLSLSSSFKLSYESPSLPDHNYYSCSPHSEQHSPSLPPRASSPVSDRSPSPAEQSITEVTSTTHGSLPCSHEFLGFRVSPGEGPSLGYPPSLSPYPPPPTTTSSSASCPSSPTLKAPVTSNLPPPAHSLAYSSSSSPPPPRQTWSPPSASYYFVDFPEGSGGNSPLFPIDLSVSGEGSTNPAFPHKPFYSLSPKTPKVELEVSPPSSPYSAPPLSQSIPIKEDPTPSSSSLGVAPSSPSSTSGPDEVVVEMVEGGTSGRTIEPPCLVDLTNEDDDDDEVEIVADDQPVVFLGSEASTRRLKRRRRHEPRPSSAAEELIVINDSTPQCPTPQSQVELDSDQTSGPNSQVVSVGSEPSSATHRANPQLFGDLNPPQVIPVERENPPAASRTSDDVGFTTILPQLGLYNLQSRLNSRAQNSSERPRPPNLRSLIEAPIPPDVFEDIVSLEAERRPSSGIVPSRLHGWPVRLEESVQHAPTLGRSAAVAATGALRLLFTSSPSHAPPASQAPLRPPRPPSGDGSGDLSCPICFESFKELKRDGKSISSTVCGHIFCTQCLEDHFKRAKQCPTCRQRLTKKQYHRLFI